MEGCFRHFILCIVRLYAVGFRGLAQDAASSSFLFSLSFSCFAMYVLIGDKPDGKHTHG